LALRFLILLLRDVMICHICSEVRIGVVSEDVTPYCASVAVIMFRRVLPCFSVSSDPIGDSGSSLVALCALSSVKAFSSPCPSDEWVKIFR